MIEITYLYLIAVTINTISIVTMSQTKVEVSLMNQHNALILTTAHSRSGIVTKRKVTDVTSHMDVM